MSGRLKTLRVAILVSLGVTAMLIAPAAASAGPVEDVVKRVGDTVNKVVDGVLGGGGGGGGAVPTPAPAPSSGEPGVPPGDPGGYVPPAHGTNPHGQGTIGTIDAPYDPETANPLPDEDAGPESIAVVGRARGEQNGDDYHGHITVLALFGQEVVGVDTEEGETEAGPLDPLQTQLLDEICTQSGGQICLEVLAADSATTDSGSTNRFAVADVSVGGTEGINATAAESNGNISDDGDCQTAHGDSTVANATIGDPIAAQVGANVLESGTTSTACNDGTQTQENTGEAPVTLTLAGQPTPIACDPDEVNQPFPINLPPLLGITCNADDPSAAGVQLSAPFGVREALTAALLGAIKVTTSAGESHAVAPGEGPEPPGPPGPPGPPDRPDRPDGPDGPDDECPDPDNPDCPGGPGGPGGPGEGPTGKGPGDLPFTGADVATLGLIGLAIVGSGLGLMALADRRRRLRGAIS